MGDNMNIDDIQFGNPREKHLKKIKRDKGGKLKLALEKGILQRMPEQPKNSSEQTRKEIEYLDRIGDALTPEQRRFCELMENNHYDFFEIVGKRLGLGVDKKEIKKWVGEIDPIVFYLKDKFNRPRPYQLARALDIELNPQITTDANSGAYPSGHSMDFLIIIWKFIQMKPELKGELNNLYKKIRSVRELSGVHYPSDRKASEWLFKELVKNKIL